MVLVSHDRHLLRTATDALALVADGSLRPFDGDLEDYRDWLMQRDGEDEPKAAPAPSRRSQKRAAAEARQARAQARKPLETRLRKIEDDIDRLSREKAGLEARLASEAFYSGGDPDEVTAALR